MANAAFKFIGNLSIVVHNASAPSDEESNDYLEALKKRDITQVRALVITAGGAPSAAQRKELNAFLNGRDYPTAVVTSVATVRGIVTALGWFNTKIKAFTPDAIEEAFKYLELRQGDFESVLSEVKKLKLEVGHADTKSAARG